MLTVGSSMLSLKLTACSWMSGCSRTKEGLHPCVSLLHEQVVCMLHLFSLCVSIRWRCKIKDGGTTRLCTCHSGSICPHPVPCLRASVRKASLRRRYQPPTCTRKGMQIMLWWVLVYVHIASEHLRVLGRESGRMVPCTIWANRSNYKKLKHFGGGHWPSIARESRAIVKYWAWWCIHRLIAWQYSPVVEVTGTKVLLEVCHDAQQASYILCCKGFVSVRGTCEKYRRLQHSRWNDKGTKSSEIVILKWCELHAFLY